MALMPRAPRDLTRTERPFSMLNMSSGTAQSDTAPVAPGSRAVGGDPASDLTGRARIRDAALHLFGERGHAATTMREIAERADVSPALVVHHFGSKQGLRDAIDDHVTEQIRAGKFAAMTGSLAPDPVTYRAMADEYAPAMAYLARALADDAEVGRRLYDRMHAHAVEYLAAGVEAGVLQPSDDPPARAAALLNAGLAQTLLRHHTRRVLGADSDLDGLLRIAGPLIDLYTDGLFADDRFRSAWSQRPDPPTPDA
jgi:AcrR family transcriptional regulator